MRKFLLLVLAVLMPLQWSIAAVAEHCHGKGGHAERVQRLPHAHDVHHGHAGHLPVGLHGQAPEPSPAVLPSGGTHAGAADARAAVTDAHSAVAGAQDASDARDLGNDASGGLAQADLHGCCHGASLPSAMAASLPAPVPASFGRPAAVPAPSSHAPEGLFRPPRFPAA